MTIESQIYGAFTGWHEDALFKLTNGQYWIQAEYKYEYNYQYRPYVTITGGLGGYVMKIDGMSNTVGVRRVDATESRIAGEFNGWSGDTTFKLQNGQIWKQASHAYWYHYAYQPEVVIYESSEGYKLALTDDDSHAIRVRRIR
jgi:hypothetical protein